MGQKNLARSRPLTRRAPSLQQRKRFLVVCEGEKTEPGYLAHVKDALRDSLMLVQVVGGLGDPLQLVQYAAERKADAAKEARKQSDDNLAFDEVWCVFDVDDFARIPQAVSAAHDSDIGLAISNPCFEVWALLHFHFSTAHLTGIEAASKLEVHMPKYSKLLDCNKLAGKYPTAKSHALKLDREHSLNDSPPGSNPSSGVWRLIDRILLSAAGSGMQDPERRI